MKEKWVVAAKSADFRGIGQHFGIDPVLARVMRNRGLTEYGEMELYLHGGISDLYDPHLLKDVSKAAEIIFQKAGEKKKIRIIGDYDIDGIMATYILLKGLTRVGAVVDTVIPDRIADGYGLNEHLVTAAYEDGIDTILTCDNGISAIEQIALAKRLGMTVVVTDHHEVPVDDKKRQVHSQADAVVNPKQEECAYPFPSLCGAAVAFKVIQVLYELAGVPGDEAIPFLENAGFATVGDVMDLQGENRVMVKIALEMLNHTKNTGMRALILQNKLTMGTIKAYHIGFRLGPCLNASGRLDTAKLSLKLLLSEDPVEAANIAREVVELNESRKVLTAAAVKQACEIVEKEHYERDKVIVVFLPECHESLAGIVAGRIREAYHRPTMIITRGEEGAKGSGRSVEQFSMYEEMCKCSELFTKFGGHPMAAGFSLPEENIDALREALNRNTALTDADLIPKVTIDVPMPIDYIYPDFIRQLDLLEPFGKANEKPVFADRNLIIDSLKIRGKEGNVISMQLRSQRGTRMNAVYFGNPGKLREVLAEKYGDQIAQDTIAGHCVHGAALHFLYYPQIDTYYGEEKLQILVSGFSA